MGTFSLICHPDTPARSVESVGVAVEQSGNRLRFLYYVECDPERVVVPKPVRPARADELWQTTCFEAFIAESARGEGAYAEFNFAPSSQWAAYSFAAYRDGMSELRLPVSPQIDMDMDDDGFAVVVSIPVPRSGKRLALSAVIEEVDGTKSYWALAHAPGKPDFHHPSCFAAPLPAPEDA